MSEIVLLVDDTDALREIIGEHLRDLGFMVLSAESGAQALRLADEHASIDVLLTDIHMPGMSGPQLAAQIKVSHPAIRIVFISGSGPLASRDPGVLASGGRVLEKPFTQAALAKALER